MLTIYKLKILLIVMIISFFSACSHQEIRQNPAYSSVRPPVILAPPSVDGAIFKSETNLAMFETVKAKRVGDILTIVFDESHSAKKESKTEEGKNSKLAMDAATILGKVVPKLAFDVGSSNDYSSNGKSEQKNSLTGSLTVSVVEILANNNLVVRGEKLLTLNQGDEYVQLSGVIRRRDIGADNKILSSKMANAQITYSGKGLTHDSNKAGWATRFFLGDWVAF